MEWDVPNWSRAIDFWNSYIPKYISSQNPIGLEIGARNGGVSLYLAARYSVRMVCSDYAGPTDKAREMHIAYGVDDKIEYQAIDVLKIPYPDNTFDVVTFKSVLGVFGYGSEKQSKERQAQGVREMYRVLKPGGILLYAENLKGSAMLDYTRKKFVPWGSTWRYVTVAEMKEYLAPFRQVEYETFGILGAVIRNETLKKIIYPLERALGKILPQSAKYIIYGVAIK